MPTAADFLPLTRADMDARGWDRPDFVYVTGDAYVDHPSFGVSIISRVLEAEGFRVISSDTPINQNSIFPSLIAFTGARASTR